MEPPQSDPRNALPEDPDTLWNLLPVELKRMVLSYLTPADLVQVMQVNRDMHTQAQMVVGDMGYWIGYWTAELSRLAEQLGWYNAAMQVDDPPEEVAGGAGEAAVESIITSIEQIVAQATVALGDPDTWTARPELAGLYQQYAATMQVIDS